MKAHYTVSELNNRKAHTSKAGKQDSQLFHVEQLTRQQIEKRFQLFRSIIPANSEDPCRQRTPYFYRREAIAWARMARQWWPTATFAPLCARFAKSYLATYRQMKSAAL
jgi:hypothetical protein